MRHSQKGFGGYSRVKTGFAEEAGGNREVPSLQQGVVILTGWTRPHFDLDGDDKVVQFRRVRKFFPPG